MSKLNATARRADRVLYALMCVLMLLLSGCSKDAPHSDDNPKPGASTTVLRLATTTSTA